MASTIGHTFGAYATTVAALVLTYLGVHVVESLITLPLGSDPSSMLAVAAGIRALLLFGAIVTMRIIGLYYHHFKDDFSWSWE